MANETTPITGWTKNGQPIETPDGIHAEDFFREGKYLGADQDGIEPVFAHQNPGENIFEQHNGILLLLSRREREVRAIAGQAIIRFEFEGEVYGLPTRELGTVAPCRASDSIIFQGKLADVIRRIKDYQNMSVLHPAGWRYGRRYLVGQGSLTVVADGRIVPISNLDPDMIQAWVENYHIHHDSQIDNLKAKLPLFLQ